MTSSVRCSASGPGRSGRCTCSPPRAARLGQDPDGGLDVVVDRRRPRWAASDAVRRRGRGSAPLHASMSGRPSGGGIARRQDSSSWPTASAIVPPPPPPPNRKPYGPASSAVRALAGQARLDLVDTACRAGPSPCRPASRRPRRTARRARISRMSSVVPPLHRTRLRRTCRSSRLSAVSAASSGAVVSVGGRIPSGIGQTIAHARARSRSACRPLRACRAGSGRRHRPRSA